MIWLFLAAAHVVLLAGGWYAYRVRQRRRVQRLIMERLTSIQQRREAWAIVDGDGIRPVKQRYAKETSR